MPAYKRKLSKGIRWFYSGQHKGHKYHSKAEYLSSAECKKAEAERLAQIDEEINKPKNTVTILEICTRRLDYLLTAKSEQYYKDNQRAFRRLLKHVGDVKIDEVTRADMHRFFLKEASRLKEEGKGNHEVNSEIRYIRALFNYAIDELEVINTNPTRKIKFYPIDKKLKYIPLDVAMDWVYESSLNHQRRLITFVKDSGARISEALRATGEDIDTDMNLLTLWTRKKRNSDLTPRRIPLPESIKEMKKNGLLFPEWKKQPRFIEELCKRLEIKVYGWHAYRHRLASIMASKNIPLVEIMTILGHDNIEVTQKYLRLLGFTRY